jgi:hypothetical protein
MWSTAFRAADLAAAAEPDEGDYGEQAMTNDEEVCA